tara:strand:+ start:1070 stop:1207 length:138 start_codon:yes stop_codon:yes gene_type:complete
MDSLKDFLKEMGLTPVHPVSTKEIPAHMVKGYYIDPRDANGEVPF